MGSLFEDRFKDVAFPVKVLYCGECSLPTEYCSYYPNYEKCKVWLEKNLPEEFERLCGVSGDGASGEGGDDAKKSGRQKRGGKGIVKAKKKSEVERHVGVYRSSRAKKKVLTVVTGLSTYGVDLKEAVKFFSSKFACGSSIVDGDVVIQGDVRDDLFDIIPERWPEIDEDSIEDLGDRKG